MRLYIPTRPSSSCHHEGPPRIPLPPYYRMKAPTLNQNQNQNQFIFLADMIMEVRQLYLLAEPPKTPKDIFGPPGRLLLMLSMLIM